MNWNPFGFFYDRDEAAIKNDNGVEDEEVWAYRDYSSSDSSDDDGYIATYYYDHSRDDDDDDY